MRTTRYQTGKETAEEKCIRDTKTLRLCVITFLITVMAIGFSYVASAQAWFNTSWGYRKAITIDFTKVQATDQANFPVLVNLSSDAGLAAHALASGNDILFTDGISTLSYEREKYTAGTGELVAWVKIPTLSHTANTVIYMYYGNAAAADQQAATAVWDANFQGVWHLKESVSPSANSTATAGRNGTWTGSVAGGTGQVGGGATFSAGTGESNVSSTFSLGTTNITMECWANLSSTSQSGAFIKIGSSTGAANNGYGIGVGGATFETTGNNFLCLFEGARWITAGTYTTGWHHFAMVINGSSKPVVYRDGVQVYSDNSTPNPVTPTASITHFGGYTGSSAENRHFTGTMDEVRISNSIRSADWLKTSFNNQNSPSTFYSLGSEVVLPTITLGTISSICPGALSFQLPYTVTGNPDVYTISGSGITTVTDQSLGGSPLTIALSSAASTGTISFTISVKKNGPPVLTSVAVNGSVTVTGLPVATSSSPVNPSCFGASDGTITITGSNGTSPYTFSVDNGLNYIGSASTPYVYGGLSANLPYKIRVRDNLGCESRSVQ